MAAASLDDLAARLEHETLRLALRYVSSHSLSELISYIDEGGRFGPTLAQMTVGELCFVGAVRPLTIDLDLLSQASAASGKSFDAYVLSVLQQSYPKLVDASYLRARLGGPRWKLQHSLTRLVKAQLVLRIGRTSDTRYSALSREP